MSHETLIKLINNQSTGRRLNKFLAAKKAFLCVAKNARKKSIKNNVGISGLGMHQPQSDWIHI